MQYRWLIGILNDGILRQEVGLRIVLVPSGICTSSVLIGHGMATIGVGLTDWETCPHRFLKDCRVGEEGWRFGGLTCDWQ